MLHPVLPPELPNVVEPKTVGEVSAGNLSTTKISTLPQESTTTKTTFERRDNSSPWGLSFNQNQKTSETSEPETVLPPEFSPANIGKNSASLGEKLSIGYPLSNQQVSSERLNHFEAQTVIQTLSKSKNLSQTKAESVTKKLANTSQKLRRKKEADKNWQKPTNIEFYSQNTSSTKAPATIEFKSRSQTQTQQQTIPIPQPENSDTQPTQQPQPSTPSTETRRVIEIIADRQIYDETRRVVTAEGNVVVRFDGSVVDADSLQVNIDNLIAVGEGNVAVTRGEQVLRGQRFTYNFIQDSGELQGGSGEVNIAQAPEDFSFSSSNAAGGLTRRPISDRIRRNQPLTNVGSPGGIGVQFGGRDARNSPGGRAEIGGEVKRMRFEAARVDFYPRGWEAKDVRITNDPFSPPELELRADSVVLNQISPRQDKLRLRRPRLVFDRGLTLGIPSYTRTIDRTQRDATPAPISIGFDGDERGGFYLERTFIPVNTQNFSWKITPQFLAQRAVDDAGNFPSIFGLKSSLNATLSPRSQVRASTTLTSLDLDELEDNLRASVRLNHLLGDTRNPHTATLEYSYRDRLFNGTLGFQTVQSSFGGIITSPNIPLGKSGLNLRYQAGAQQISANTDRQDLLDVNRNNDRISLGRFQASATIGGGINLWRGKPLAPTANKGLKYTSNPVVPYVQAFGSVTGTGSFYTNGDNQNTLTGTIGLQGQFGHFSKPVLDYTGFNISYSQGTNDGLSPFLFDRFVDNKILNVGITQQLYGPFRLGFQTSINLDTSERASTDYILEYSRRTYGISLRYNPVLELGGISFRINDFNWTGGTDPFSDDSEVKPVVGGVEQR